jgi:Methyltransferase domain
MKPGQVLETTLTVLRNVILGGNIISFSLLARPQEMVNYISESLFLYKTINSKRGVPQKNVYEVLPADNIETIRLGNLKGVAWFLTRASNAVDIVSLCLICQIIKPKIVFEIGTMWGYTSFHFALNTPDDTMIHTLDLPQNKNVGLKLKTTITDDIHIKSHSRSEQYCFENSDVASKIKCLFSDSADFDFSPFYNKVDFFFIDGAHSYEYVRSDTLNALKCCHPGSVIAWHDFGRVGVNGVTEFLLVLAKEGYDIYAIPGGSLAFTIIK